MLGALLKQLKLFSRLFLGQDAEILLPNEFIMKPSHGDFRQNDYSERPL